MQLAGKRIIVTGGARGIGAAVVKAFVEEGAYVVSLDLGEAASMTGDGGGWAHTRVCDIADSQSVDAAFAWANERLNGLDVLVHAAGIAPNASADSITLDEWEKVFAVNTRGTFLTNRAAYELLKGSGGRIINFASGAGVIGQPGKAHYAASKGGRAGVDAHGGAGVGPIGHYRQRYRPGDVDADVRGDSREHERRTTAAARCVHGRASAHRRTTG